MFLANGHKIVLPELLSKPSIEAGALCAMPPNGSMFMTASMRPQRLPAGTARLEPLGQRLL